MALSVQRVVNVDPVVVITAGSNDHLQSRGLLNALIDGSTPSSEVGGREINTAMFCEATGQSYLRAVSWLCLATRAPAFRVIPVVPFAEGRLDVRIPVPNRQVDPNLYYLFRS